MAVQQVADDFGQKLREARERRGLSLRQIASATKISMITLEALERNDIARLPGGIFSRAFVRSYALEVGLDPEETIQQFMGQFPHDSVTAGHPTSVRPEDYDAVEGDRWRPPAFLRVIVAVVPIAVLVVYFGTAGRRVVRQMLGGQAAESGASLKPASGVQSPTAGSSDPADVPAVVVDSTAVAPDPPATGRLVIQLRAVQRSWVSADVDGQPALRRALQPGDEQTLDVRRDVVLTVGDGGAITVTLNGAAAKPIGPSGQTATARLNLTNFREYLVAP
jgi:transcriptional regulator with XRE-family HTH domain